MSTAAGLIIGSMLGSNFGSGGFDIVEFTKALFFVSAVSLGGTLLIFGFLLLIEKVYYFFHPPRSLRERLDEMEKQYAIEEDKFQEKIKSGEIDPKRDYIVRVFTSE